MGYRRSEKRGARPATLRRNLAMPSDVLDALKRSAAIPSLPQVVTRFLEVIRDPDFDFDAVADVLAADPGMAADILRLVNSPLFGMTRKVSSLHQGLTLLGLRRVRSLVLGRYLVDSMGGTNMGGVDASYFWRRSLATAVMAAKFVDARLPAVRDEAFIGGLLCDTGVIVMAEAMSAYAPVAKKYAPHQEEDICAAEAMAVGMDHCQVSAAVLEHWQLPELVTDAVALHHATEIPPDTSEEVSTVARSLQGAGAIGKLLCETSDPKPAVDVCRRAMDRVGLDLSVLARCLDEVEVEIRDLADVLRIDIIPSKVYGLLAAELSKELAQPVG